MTIGLKQFARTSTPGYAKALAQTGARSLSRHARTAMALVLAATLLPLHTNPQGASPAFAAEDEWTKTGTVLHNPVPVSLNESSSSLPLGHHSLFGQRLALFNDTMVAGSTHGGSNREELEQVLVLERDADNWDCSAVLTPNAVAECSSAPARPVEKKGFGSQVAIDRFDGSSVAVSAQREQVGGFSDAGAVYVFDRTEAGFASPVRLTSPNPKAGSNFGRSIAIYGGLLAVGSEDDTGTSATTEDLTLVQWVRVGDNTFTDREYRVTAEPTDGSEAQYCYVPHVGGNAQCTFGDPFPTTGWGSQPLDNTKTYRFSVDYRDGDGAWNKLPRGAGQPPTDLFFENIEVAPGVRIDQLAVKIDGTTSISASFKILRASLVQRLGVVYLYERDAATGWPTTPTATLTAPFSFTTGGFGELVSLFGERLAVTERDLVSGYNALHIFRKTQNGWMREHSAEELVNQAGHGLSLGEQLVAVGSEFFPGQLQDEFGNVLDRGNAFAMIRDGNTWGSPVSLRSVATEANAQPAAWFGGNVAVDGDVVAVGFGRGRGGVYLFQAGLGGNVSFLDSWIDADPFGNSAFGQGLALSGGVLVAGAPWDGSLSGCAGARCGLIHTFLNPGRTLSLPGGGTQTALPPAQETPAPVRSPQTAALPRLRPGSGSLVVGSETVTPVVVPTVDLSGMSGVSVQGDGFSIAVEPSRPDGGRGSGDVRCPDGSRPRTNGVLAEATRAAADCGLATAGEPQLLLVKGESTRTSVNGFAPFSVVRVWLFSEPFLLGTFVTSSAGDLEAAVANLPDDVTACPHTLQAEGRLANGQQVAASVGVWVYAEPFADVTLASPHGPAIGCLESRSVVRGYADGRFGEADYLTQAQAAWMLNGLGVKAPAQSLLDAFDRDARLAGDVWRAPNRPLTRGEAAELLIAAFHVDRDATHHVDDGTAASGGYQLLVDAGVFSGYRNGQLGFDRPVTRGQFASLLVRAERAFTLN